jgi:hypothetical protein
MSQQTSYPAAGIASRQIYPILPHSTQVETVLGVVRNGLAEWFATIQAMSAAADIWAVLSFYALDRQTVRLVEPIGSGGGWSGSRLWRVTDAAGRRFCLRCWPPEHPSAERLRFIHAVLLHVAGKLPVVACPVKTATATTFVEHSDHLWELAAWRPGEADSREHPNPARVRAAMHILARFHDVTRPQRDSCHVAPALMDRRREHSYHRFGGVLAIEQSLNSRLGDEIDHRADRLLSLARQALDAPFWQMLSKSPHVPLQIVIRDIHRDHVLFTGDEVTGLIDFGAMRRFDTPLTDVARLVGSMAGDDEGSRRFAVDAYSELRPLSDVDRQLVDFLDESNLVLAGLNWLTWLYVERRDMGPVAPIVRRLDALSMRLARLLAK